MTTHNTNNTPIIESNDRAIYRLAKQDPNKILIHSDAASGGILVDSITVMVGMGSCQCGDLYATITKTNGKFTITGDNGYGLNGYGLGTTMCKIKEALEAHKCLTISWKVDAWRRTVRTSLHTYEVYQAHIIVPTALYLQFDLTGKGTNL